MYIYIYTDIYIHIYIYMYRLSTAVYRRDMEDLHHGKKSNLQDHVGFRAQGIPATPITYSLMDIPNQYFRGVVGCLEGMMKLTLLI